MIIIQFFFLISLIYTIRNTPVFHKTRTSNGAFSYLPDVHRNGGSDSADDRAGYQTGDVQLPDGRGEVDHRPADDERYG